MLDWYVGVHKESIDIIYNGIEEPTQPISNLWYQSNIDTWWVSEMRESLSTWLIFMVIIIIILIPHWN